MKKVTFLLLLLPVAILPVMAQSQSTPQKKFNLGMGIGAGASTTAPGVCNASLDLQGEYRAARQFSLFSSVGYNRMFSFIVPGGAGYGSLLAGPRAWISNKFFTGVGAGVALGIADGTTATIFSYDPHIGLNNKNAQFTLGYDVLSQSDFSTGFLQFRALIKFGKSQSKSTDVTPAE